MRAQVTCVGAFYLWISTTSATKAERKSHETLQEATMRYFRKRHPLLFFLTVVALGISAGTVPAYLFSGRRGKSDTLTSEEKLLPPLTRVKALGSIGPAGGIIELGVLGPDRLGKLAVREGDVVRQGQRLAVLDSHALRKSEWELAKKQLQEAHERLAGMTLHLQRKIQEIDGAIRQAEAQTPLDAEIQTSKIHVLDRQLAMARDVLQRMRQAGSYTQHELDQQQLTVRQAEEELHGATTLLEKLRQTDEANLDATRARRATARAGLRRAISENPLGSLKTNVELAEQRLNRTVLRAPVKGTVLRILAREGELVGTRPVLQLADTSSMVVVAEVYETDVAAVRTWQASQPVRATAEARFTHGKGRLFHGTVERVSDVVLRNSVFSLDPRRDVDRRVVEVRIRLDKEDCAEAAHFINMQVEVTIEAPLPPGKTGRKA